MKDIIVLQSLRNRGVTLDDVQEVLRYEAVEHQPRVLDKAPKRLTFMKHKDLPVYNTCSEFTSTYDELRTQTSLEMGQLNIKGNMRNCDPEIFLTLQALISESFTCSEDRAVACFELFKRIMLTPGNPLTVGKVREELDKYTPTSVYSMGLYEGIRTCLFKESPVEFYWLKSVAFDHIFSNAVSIGKDYIKMACPSKEAVDELVKVMYDEYLADEDFVAKYSSEFKKLGTKKPLIGLIHRLHKTQPTVLEYGDIVPSGFASSK